MQKHISLILNLRERGSDTGLVGDTDMEGLEERWFGMRDVEYEGLALSFHKTLVSRKLHQAIQQVTVGEGGGCLLPEDKCTNNGQTVI